MNNVTVELNPFSSRCVSPLTCRYVESEASEGLRQRLAQGLTDQRWIQIIGPHGSGKTTIAVFLAHQLRHRFERASVITIRRTPRKSVAKFSVVNELLYDNVGESDGDELVILDGLECLSLIQRSCLMFALRQRQTSLIITGHQPVWFISQQATMVPNRDHFRSIARSLLSDSSFELGDDVIDAVFDNSRGNYRNGLNLLYDHLAKGDRAGETRCWRADQGR